MFRARRIDCILIRAALLLALAACSDTGAPADTGDPAGETAARPDAARDGDARRREVPPGVVRIIHFSDVHYLGSPKDPGPHHMAAGAAELNDLQFEADLAVVTGDLVGFVAPEYEAPGVQGPVHLCLSHLSALDAPVAATPGNHDYCSAGEPLTLAADKTKREAMLADALGASPLYRSLDVNGIRLVLLNSMDGVLWDADGGIAGSFLDAQLAWLEDQLSAGLPALLFLHHPPGTLVATGDQDTLCDLMDRHPGTVKGIFSGHMHGFSKSDYCGVPSYVVTRFAPEEAFYFLIEYDGQADALTLLNEDEIEFSKLPEFECLPGEDPLADPPAAVGSVQQLLPANMTADAPDIGKCAGDIFEAIPFLVRFDSWDAEATTFHARLTLGAESDEVQGYMDHRAGLPCRPIEFSLTDPCFMAGPVSFSVDASLFSPLLPGQAPDILAELPIPIEDFWFAGGFSGAEGTPVIDSGVLHARILGVELILQFKESLVAEYCAGHIEDCLPGSAAAMPECPGPDPGSQFFPSIPAQCDIQVDDHSLRLLLATVEALGLADCEVAGNLTSRVVPLSDTPLAGTAAPALFATDPGSNCAP